MGLTWPALSNTSSQLGEDTGMRMRASIDRIADAVEAELTARGLPRYASPMWSHWDLSFIADSHRWWFVFLVSKGGVVQIDYIDMRNRTVDEATLREKAAEELGQRVSVIFHVDPSAPDDVDNARAQILAHVDNLEREAKIGAALDDAPHLAPYISEFLGDHPDRSRNVFIMMRFHESEQLTAAHQAIVTTLAERGLHAIRADDRDYTGDLWSNIELCMRLSTYGIAVFEHIDTRDFNPNVSLELGFMLGAARRVLILKEKQLPALPADVVHKLYRPWDAFKTTETVSAQVAAWIDRDLRI